jgi:hypothetical protein
MKYMFKDLCSKFPFYTHNHLFAGENNLALFQLFTMCVRVYIYIYIYIYRFSNMNFPKMRKFLSLNRKGLYNLYVIKTPMKWKLTLTFEN